MELFPSYERSSRSSRADNHMKYVSSTSKSSFDHTEFDMLDVQFESGPGE